MHSVLHLFRAKRAYVSDGLNLFTTDSIARASIVAELDGLNIVHIPFRGQNREDQCASSAVATMIEIQRIYENCGVLSELTRRGSIRMT